MWQPQGDCIRGSFSFAMIVASVAELDDDEIRDLLQKKAKRFGFEINDEMVEIKGYCQECRGSKR